MYAPVVTRFKTYGVIPTLDPICQTYCEAVLAHPAMKEWYAGAATEALEIAVYEAQTVA